MYEGPIIDTFLHAPWIGDRCGEERADLVPWTDDPRLRRVLQTFHHDGEGEKEPWYSLDDVLRDLSGAAVDEGVLAAKVYYRSTGKRVDILHKELSRLCAASGGRLRWIATLVPPEAGPASYWDLMENVRLLRAVANDPNLVGVHITPSPWGLAPNDRWYYPVYAACADLGLTLYAYVGMPGPLWPMGPNNPAHLEDVALAFPDMPIVAHHIGDPWTDIAVRLAARHEKFYICTSAWHPKAYPAPLKEFMASGWHGTRGSDKILFASDYPLMNIEKTAAAARKIDLPAEDLSKILHGNARSLLFGARR